MEPEPRGATVAPFAETSETDDSVADGAGPQSRAVEVAMPSPGVDICDEDSEQGLTCADVDAGAEVVGTPDASADELARGDASAATVAGAGTGPTGGDDGEVGRADVDFEDTTGALAEAGDGECFVSLRTEAT